MSTTTKEPNLQDGIDYWSSKKADLDAVLGMSYVLFAYRRLIIIVGGYGSSVRSYIGNDLSFNNVYELQIGLA